MYLNRYHESFIYDTFNDNLMWHNFYLQSKYSSLYLQKYIFFNQGTLFSFETEAIQKTTINQIAEF